MNIICEIIVYRKDGTGRYIEMDDKLEVHSTDLPECIEVRLGITTLFVDAKKLIAAVTKCAESL